MAEVAHAVDLPGRFAVADDWTEIEPAAEGAAVRGACEASGGAEAAVTYRQGYFLGDGTGAGKGRQVAGVILAGWLAGRTRAVWISKSKTLIEDAVRDWSDLGGAPSDIVPLERWKPDEGITLRRGILFLTYATLRSVGKTGRSRLEQLVEWCGAGFEGVIAFDEAHAMANAARSSDGPRAGPRRRSRGSPGCAFRSPCPAPASSTSRRRAPRTSATSPTPRGWGSGDRDTPTRSPRARTSWPPWSRAASRRWRWWQETSRRSASTRRGRSASRASSTTSSSTG